MPGDRLHGRLYPARNELPMAKNQNTFEKRRREVEKKFKADEKRKSRLKKKSAESQSVTSDRIEEKTPEEST